MKVSMFEKIPVLTPSPVIMKPNLILIAGAGSGIGLHLAKTLHQKGCELLLLDLNNMIIRNFASRTKIGCSSG